MVLTNLVTWSDASLPGALEGLRAVSVHRVDLDVIVLAANQNPLPIRTKRNSPCMLSIIQRNILFPWLRFQVVHPHSAVPPIRKIFAVRRKATSRYRNFCCLVAATLQLCDELVVLRVVQAYLGTCSDRQHLVIRRHSEEHDVLIGFKGAVRRVLLCFF